MSESSAITAALGAGLGALAGMVFGIWLAKHSHEDLVARIMGRVETLEQDNQMAFRKLRALEGRSHLAQPRTAGGRFAKKGGE